MAFAFPRLPPWAIVDLNYRLSLVLLSGAWSGDANDVKISGPECCSKAAASSAGSWTAPNPNCSGRPRLSSFDSAPDPPSRADCCTTSGFDNC